MAEGGINIIEIQSFQGVSHTLDDVFAGKSFRVGC